MLLRSKSILGRIWWFCQILTLQFIWWWLFLKLPTNICFLLLHTIWTYGRTLQHNQNIILSLRNHLCHTFSCGCLVAYKYMSSDKAAIDEMVVNTVFFCHCYVMPRIWYLIFVILFTQTKNLDQLVRVTLKICFWRLSKRKPKELTKIANRNSTMTNSPVTKHEIISAEECRGRRRTRFCKPSES